MSHAVLTGPITGSVTLPDGREIDVSMPLVEVDDQATADAVAHAIACRYRDEGHPTDPEFTYGDRRVHHDRCGRNNALGPVSRSLTW